LYAARVHAGSEQRGSRPAVGDWEAVSRPARPIVKELLVNGPRTRTELARRLGLSNGSLTRLTKPLVESGLLVERGTVHDPVNGHPTRPLDVVADAYHFLGVKLTSDHMHAVVTDLRSEVAAERSEPLGDRTPEGVAAQARDLMDRLARDSAKPAAAGFALGGRASPGGDAAEAGLFDAPFLGWRRVPLESVLNAAMGIPCVVGNDVHALARGQHWFGEARGLADFALATAGAGIGYAVCRDDRILETTEEDVVAFGHHILDPGGPMCPTGHRGCVSAYLSTGALLSAAAYGLHRPVSPEEIARRAREGDVVCGDIARLAGWAVGAVAAGIANHTGVRTVLVAGESVDVIRAGSRHIEQGLSERRFSGSVDILMLSSSSTDWSRGGAVEAIRAFVIREG
jgi:predicted NBD/HSP70 family sugar kinase